jgi:hypothetical protein
MDFQGFPKIARYSRTVVVTEKIDGTNAQILITPDLQFAVGSRTRWITPEKDNHGFARWAYEHKDELIAGLGPGRHFGEWWGSGIQRGYGLKNGEKRFSLFNTERWESIRPDCCHVVPLLACGEMGAMDIIEIMDNLRIHGSSAAPGYMNPEGIVIYHTAAGISFKKTIINDTIPKSLTK